MSREGLVHDDPDSVQQVITVKTDHSLNVRNGELRTGLKDQPTIILVLCVNLTGLLNLKAYKIHGGRLIVDNNAWDSTRV